MPIHDWTKMLDGDFHDFHQSWINELAVAMNKMLPRPLVALLESAAARS